MSPSAEVILSASDVSKAVLGPDGKLQILDRVSLSVPTGDPHVVFQWGTLVLPEHRGHRLGMAVKVANLEQLARLAPERRSVQTMNDEQNPWMVQINKDLGFEIIEEALTMKKAF